MSDNTLGDTNPERPFGSEYIPDDVIELEQVWRDTEEAIIELEHMVAHLKDLDPSRELSTGFTYLQTARMWILDAMEMYLFRPVVGAESDGEGT